MRANWFFRALNFTEGWDMKWVKKCLRAVRDTGWLKECLRALNFTEHWTYRQQGRYKKILKSITIVLLVALLVWTLVWTTFVRPERVVERVVEVPVTVIQEVEVVPIEIQNQLTGLEAENTALEEQIAEAQNQVAGLEVIIAALQQQIAGLESEKAALQQQIDELEAENAALQQQIAALIAANKGPDPVIMATNVVGTITAQEALALIKASCPKTGMAGGLRAVEFAEADLVSETVFKSWLAQDKTEDEVLGDPWNYIAALEYKLRLQPGGKDIPINRARCGDETLAAVILHDGSDARLYVFDPLEEEGMRKIDPANPDQIIEYVHLD